MTKKTDAITKSDDEIENLQTASAGRGKLELNEPYETDEDLNQDSAEVNEELESAANEETYEEVKTRKRRTRKE